MKTKDEDKNDKLKSSLLINNIIATRIIITSKVEERVVYSRE